MRLLYGYRFSHACARPEDRPGVRIDPQEAAVVCAVLAVGLAVGTAWSYLRLRAVQPAYSRLLTAAAARTGSQPGTDLQERLVRDRAFVEQAAAIRRGRISEFGTRLFMPASIQTERRLSAAVRDVFAAMLVDFQRGLAELLVHHRAKRIGPGDVFFELSPPLAQLLFDQTAGSTFPDDDFREVVLRFGSRRGPGGKPVFLPPAYGGFEVG